MKKYELMTDEELWREIENRYGKSWEPDDIEDNVLREEYWKRTFAVY